MSKEVQLENLRDNVRYWEYRFNNCSPHQARAMQQMVIKAKEQLKEYKQKYFPALLVPPTYFKSEPYIRMSDWTENFEEYSNQ